MIFSGWKRSATWRANRRITRMGMSGPRYQRGDEPCASFCAMRFTWLLYRVSSHLLPLSPARRGRGEGLGDEKRTNIPDPYLLTPDSCRLPPTTYPIRAFEAPRSDPCGEGPEARIVIKSDCFSLYGKKISGLSGGQQR